MTGITSFGAYIPFYRLAHKEIARAWGGRAGEGERAVANLAKIRSTMADEVLSDCKFPTVVGARETKPDKEALRGVECSSLNVLFLKLRGEST